METMAISINWDGPTGAEGFGGTDTGARLTTEHAASSYGHPVVVTGDGVVLGPQDRPRLTIGWGHDVEMADRSVDWNARLELFRRAVNAGYRVGVRGLEEDEDRT